VELRDRLSKNGFDAEGYGKSSPASIVMDNNKQNGYIGWTVPFMFNAKVEDAIYSLPVNEVSRPIRASDGYHIVQVSGRRPAVGAADVEQVLFNFTQIPPGRHQTDSVGKVAWREYGRIHSSTDYKALCDEFARVMEMGDRGCRFGVVALDSRLSPSFIDAALNLKNEGDITEPVLSDYGYHIIRLVKKIPVPSFGDLKISLRERIIKSDKSQEMTGEKREKMAKALDYTLNKEAYDKLNGIADKVSPRDSAFFGMVENPDDVLFSFGNKERYTVGNFVEYIRLRHKLLNKKSMDAPEMSIFTEAINNTLSTDILSEYFNVYRSRCLTDYYYITLADREPGYREQLEEISDGLLSFAVMNKNIWERSAVDEKGLAGYFNRNKNRYSLSDTKYRGLIVHARNEKALSTAESLAKEEKDRDALIRKLRNTLNKDSSEVLMEPGTWSKGENKYVDNKIFEGKEVQGQMGYPFFFVTGEFISAPVDYNDVRSAVEADYQDELEKNWKTYLRNKYKVEVDNAVLKTIK
jgi:peptidyl-prolyl cis-trans isomerase SurA